MRLYGELESFGVCKKEEKEGWRAGLVKHTKRKEKGEKFHMMFASPSPSFYIDATDMVLLFSSLLISMRWMASSLSSGPRVGHSNLSSSPP